MASALPDTASNSTDGAFTELEEKTVNKIFDEAFQLFRSVNDFEGETTSLQFQEKLQKGIKLCEDITNTVTSLEMFSGNESVEELPTNHIKFLLLPFMLGKLWQLKTDKDRKDICIASQIYFQDFLQRLFDYKIIKTLPKSMEKGNEDEDGEKTKKKPVTQQLSSNDLRAQKIATLKENKALDLKIKSILEKQKTNEELDDDSARELFLSVIQRSHNESIQELDSIAKEIELIEFAQKMKEQKGGGDGDSKKPLADTKKSTGGIQTFILTRSEVEKKVYGLGYPALPVMTVEELYAQRRAEGTWGPPPTGNDLASPLTEEQQADREGAENDLREEADDPERIQYLRGMDEYKDMHRRGWGNRTNRS